MATVSLLLRSVSKQNCADGFVCRMGSARGLQERANMGMPGRFTNGMDLWGDDAAFYRITSISCLLNYNSFYHMAQFYICGIFHCNSISLLAT